MPDAGEPRAVRERGEMARRSLLLAAPALLAARPVRAAREDTPLRVVIPYAPGGGTDVFGRLLAEALSDQLDQPVVVENRAGANGVIGSEAVMRAAPNGQTLLIAVSTHVLNRYVMAPLPFDPLKDFTPVARLCRTASVLVTGARSPFRSVGDVLGRARAEPGTVSIGYSEASTAYAGYMLAQRTGTSLIAVPYRGGAPLMTDLLAGNLMVAVTSTGSAAAHLRAGTARALGVTPGERMPTLPEVPTIAEQGVPGYDHAGWYGLFGPARLPAAMAERLAAAVSACMTTQPLRARLEELGGALDVLPPAAFAAFLAEDDRRWGEADRAGALRSMRDL